MTSYMSEKFGELRFSASIDYLKLAGLSKTHLPQLDGDAKWPKSASDWLTIHRCSPADLSKLQVALPSVILDEMEVCVDIRVVNPASREHQTQVLDAVKRQIVSRGLHPEFLDGTNSGFRGAYVPEVRKTVPFNLRVPDVSEQLLYGHRNDGAQTKSYFKVTDNRKALDWKQHSVRIEIRLGSVGLSAHHLLTIGDLQAFRFRKKLMPYFRHVCGVRPCKTRKASTPLLDVLKTKQAEIDECHWQKIGVGAFLKGGRRNRAHLIFQRDTTINNRIGQALMRLERAVAAEKFVCQKGAS